MSIVFVTLQQLTSCGFLARQWKMKRIHDGDVLVVDRSLTASHGSIVVACIHNEFTVKRLLLRPRPCLMPMNKDFPVYYIDPDNESVEIWGVVTHSLIEHPVCLR